MKYTTALIAAFAAATVSAAPSYHKHREHTVIVGGKDILRYNPEHVKANPGDTIKFIFMQKNHTLTESTFDSPCTKLDDMRAFDTDFVPNIDDMVVPAPTKILRITSRKPRYFYCQQGNHCKQGMVFAVNSRKGIEKFKQKAMEGNGNQTPPPAPSAPAQQPPANKDGYYQPQPAAGGDNLLQQIKAGFDTTGNTGLEFDYASNGFGVEGDAKDLSNIDTTVVPRFALCGSCANAPGNKFIIAMIDVDAAKPRLHYLRTDFDTAQPDGAPEDLISNERAIVAYQGPETTKNADGKDVHQYVFLQIAQPKDQSFKIDPMTVNVENFDLSEFYRVNNLEAAEGGATFLKKVGA